MGRSELDASLPDAHRAFELRSRIAAGDLERVVPVGQSVTGHHVTVELLAIEIRSTGFRGWLRFAWPVGFPMLGWPIVSIGDNFATAYASASQVTSQLGSAAEAEVLATPSPPLGTPSLRVAIERFSEGPSLPAPFSSPHVGLEGPWTFVVPLTGR